MYPYHEVVQRNGRAQKRSKHALTEEVLRLVKTLAALGGTDYSLDSVFMLETTEEVEFTVTGTISTDLRRRNIRRLTCGLSAALGTTGTFDFTCGGTNGYGIEIASGEVTPLGVSPTEISDTNRTSINVRSDDIGGTMGVVVWQGSRGGRTCEGAGEHEEGIEMHFVKWMKNDTVEDEIRIV